LSPQRPAQNACDGICTPGPSARSIRSGDMADGWVDRCPVCDAGFAEIGVMGHKKPVEVVCAGPEKHFFSVLEKDVI
jgi:hypothetical protein